MSAQSIYLALVEGGMSRAAACGMLGNMQAESALRSNNAQDSYGRNDAAYTAAVDAGGLDAGYSFVYDGVGYGLCQWTSSDRKNDLLTYAKREGVSIADEAMQVRFCLWELKEKPEYAGLWNFLQSANGVAEAAKRICLEFERPADAKKKAPERADYANEFFMRLAGLEAEPVPEAGTPEAEPESAFWPPRTLSVGMYGVDVVALQGLLIARGYPAGITGTFDAATGAQLRAFQRRHDLKDDGICGPQTWAKLVEGAA